MRLNFSVKTKIILGFAIVLALFIFASAASIKEAIEIERRLRFLNDGYIPLSRLLARFELHRTNSSQEIEKLIEQNKNRRKTQVWVHIPRISESFIENATRIATKLIKENLTTYHQNDFSEIVTRLNELKDLNNNYKVIFQNIGELIEANNFNEAKDNFNEFKNAESALDLGVKNLAQRLDFKTKGELKRIEYLSNKAKTLILIVSAIAIIAGLLFAFISIITLNPLKKLKQLTREIIDGDYSKRINIKSGDEVGELANEFNHMAQALQNREKELENQRALLIKSERLATIGKVSSKITHEIKNPLNSIGLNLELLQDAINSPNTDRVEESKRILATLTNEIDRLNLITDEYLNYVKLPKIEMFEENINEIITGISKFIEREAKKKNIDLRLQLAKDLPLAAINVNHVKQAFLNIIKNSIEAIDKNGTINITTKTLENSIEILIADSGKGIKQENIEKIFDPFYTTKDNGTGLGLALTAQIVKEHSGNISCESKPGKGTEFKITLPVKRENRV